MDTTVHVYHYRPNLPLRRLSVEIWASFCEGDLPLEPTKYDKIRGISKLWVLVVTIRDSAIDSIEPFAVEVDSQGYVLRRELSPLPQLDRLATGILDVRDRFIGRYLRHTHEWHPDPEILAQAVHASTALMPRAAEPRR